MNTRFAILTVIPLLAVEPALSNAADQRDAFPDQQLMQQLQQAQDYAIRAGQDLAHSLVILQQAIPRYGLPYVDDRGNIVIPRLAPPNGTPVPDPGPSGL